MNRMYKTIICSALLIMTLSVFAAGETESVLASSAEQLNGITLSYFEVEEYSQNPFVKMSRIDEFIEKIRQDNIRQVFYIVNPNFEGKLCREFFYVSESVIYTLGAQNYRNLSDQVEGLSSGFSRGEDYYSAKKIGIHAYAEYEPYKNRILIDEGDLAWYRKNSEEDSFIPSSEMPFPQKVEKNKFENEYIDVLINMYIDMQPDYISKFENDRKDVKPVRSSNSYSNNRTATISEESYGIQNDFGTDNSARLQIISMLKENQWFLTHVSNWYLYKDGYYWHAETPVGAALFEEKRKDSRNNNSLRGFRVYREPQTLHEPDSMYRLSPSSSRYANGIPSLYFYYAGKYDSSDFLSGMNLQQKYEYLVDSDYAKRGGFEEVEVFRIARSRGFYRNNTYQEALENGFILKSDYDAAHRLGLGTKDLYDRYLELVAKFKESQHSNNLQEFTDAVIFRFLETLPGGTVLSVQNLEKEYIAWVNDAIEPDFRRPLETQEKYASRVDTRYIIDFFQRSQDAVKKIGRFDQRGGGFVRF